MKTNYATWDRYLKSWPDDWHYDDSDETINGVQANQYKGEPQPADVVEFSCGVIFRGDKDRDGITLPAHFRRWLKEQSSVSVLVSVPRDNLDELKAAAKALGGKVEAP